MENPQQTSFSRGRNRSSCLCSGTRRGCPLSPLVFNIALAVLATAARQQKRKGIQISQGEVKLPLRASDVILYTENLKYSTKKLVDLINEFIKVAGYKMSVQIRIFPHGRVVTLSAAALFVFSQYFCRLGLLSAFKHSVFHYVSCISSTKSALWFHAVSGNPQGH